MSSKTHTTAVVLIPQQTIQPPIQDIRRIHDRNYQRWMPHITLLYPFAQHSNFSNVIPALEESAKHTCEFSVTLSAFNAFKHRKSCTMFLVPEPKDDIMQLHRTLLEHLPDYDDTARFPNGFNPHLSVGQFSHQSLQQEQSNLQNEWQPLQFHIESLALIYRSAETNDRFVVAENFPFQERSQS